VVALGLVPDVSPGVDLVFDARLSRRWGFSLAALYVSKAVAESQGRTVDVSLTTFGAALTYAAIRTESFRMAPDAGLMAGALHAAVRGGAAIGTGEHAVFLAGFGVRAEGTVSDGLVLAARVGAVVPVVGRNLRIEGSPDPLWTQPGFAGMGSLGAGWAFF
jgi:hypothetical protein